MARPKEAVMNKKPSKPALELGTDIQQKFTTARMVMSRHMVERNDEIDLVLTALICHEHPMLIGPHGAGKTMLLDAVGDWIQVPKRERFNYMLTKYTDPSEIFGMVDIAGLNETPTRYERIVDGLLPTAKLAFFGELWKASPAILNTLLMVINERFFKYAKQEVRCPLRMMMADSNEFPQDQDGGKELAPMFDRFLFRKKVNYVSENGQRELLKRSVDNSWGPCPFQEHISMNEVDQAHEEAMQLPWSSDAKRVMWSIIEELKKEGVNPGDRRLTKSIGAARGYAYLAGAEEVEPEHLEILAHVLWDDPAEQPEKCARVVAKLANPLKTTINGLLTQAIDVNLNCPLGQEKINKLEDIKQRLDVLKENPQKEYALDSVDVFIKQAHYSLMGVRK